MPLVLEYESVLNREIGGRALPSDAVANFLDYVCAVSNHQSIHYLWRPQLPDPGDDMLLEAAVAAVCSYIVTFNVRHFENVEQFGIRAVTPVQFLRILETSR